MDCVTRGIGLLVVAPLLLSPIGCAPETRDDVGVPERKGNQSAQGNNIGDAFATSMNQQHVAGTHDGGKYGRARASGAVHGRRPQITVFPNMLRVPRNTQESRSIWIVNNESSEVILGRPRFSCGCLGAKGCPERLEEYGAVEIKLAFAPVRDRDSDFATFPFTWNNTDWELEVRVTRQ